MEKPDASASWLDRVVYDRPSLPYVGPFMVFLLGTAAHSQPMSFIPWFGWPDLMPALYPVKTLLTALTLWVFWRYYPPLGKPYFLTALAMGIATFFMWVWVHKWCAGFEFLSGFLYTEPAPEDYFIPHEKLGTGAKYWTFLVLRIGGAVTVVAVMEELFWRGFLLRWLIRFDRWENIPLAKFTWGSFIICSLLSAAEHPLREVGVLCWVMWNLLFYWRKSLLCLIITHGITNLLLYIYVVVYEDWVFW